MNKLIFIIAILVLSACEAPCEDHERVVDRYEHQYDSNGNMITSEPIMRCPY